MTSKMQQLRPESTAISTPNAVENPRLIIDVRAYLESAEELLRLQEQQQYDVKEDFDWFSSGQVNTDLYKGQYIAIWKKKIVGNGSTAIEAERIAKFHCGEDCSPAIVYVPEDEEAIL